MTRLAVIAAIAIFVLLVGIFATRLEKDTDPTLLPSALIGKPLAAFVLPPIPGRGKAEDGLARDDLASGQASIVNFWGSWCTPCRVEHPMLLSLAKRHGAILHGVNYKDQPEKALAYLIELGDPFNRIGMDNSGRAAIDWGVYAVPETFVVNGQGVVVAKVVGNLTADNIKYVIEPALTRAVAGASSPNGNIKAR